MSPTMTRPSEAPARYMQGIAVPAEAVRPEEFFRRTRRHIRTEKIIPYVGQTQEVVELRKADILSGITIRFSGQIVTTTPTGTVTSTARWPYDFLKAIKLTANGASNLINCSGLKLKVRDIMKQEDLTDRGVAQTVGGVSVSQGTLALASESWGVGSRSNVAAGTYPVELEWFVPVAEDERDLAGAIFLATSSTGVTLQLDIAALTDLLVTTLTATAVLTGSFQVIATKFSIPVGADGGIVVPDLSTFHSLIEARVANGLSNGENELRIVGQGAGKSMLRVFFQTWNGATPQAPLAMNATNYGKQMWRYATNETPDEFIDGRHLNVDQERRYGTDIGSVWGFGCHDFAHQNAFRDVVDMGTTSELRLVTNIQSGVALTNPALEYVVETMFSAGQAA